MEASASNKEKNTRETRWRSYSKSLIVELKEKLEDRRTRTLGLLAENNDLSAFRDLDTESDGLDDTSTNLTNDKDSYVRHYDLTDGQMLEPLYLSDSSSLAGSDLCNELENGKEYEATPSPDSERYAVGQLCSECSSTVTSVSSVSDVSEESNSECSREKMPVTGLENTTESQGGQQPRHSQSATLICDQDFNVHTFSDGILGSPVSVIQESKNKSEQKFGFTDGAVASSSDLIRCLLECSNSTKVSALGARQTKSDTLFPLHLPRHVEPSSVGLFRRRSFECLQSELQFDDFLPSVANDKREGYLADILPAKMDDIWHECKQKSPEPKIENKTEVKETKRFDHIELLGKKGQGEEENNNFDESIDKLHSDKTTPQSVKEIHHIFCDEEVTTFRSDNKCVPSHEINVDSPDQTKTREKISDISFSNQKEIIEEILNLLESNRDLYKLIDKNVIFRLEDDFSGLGVFQTQYQNISHNSGYTNTLKPSSKKGHLQNIKAGSPLPTSRINIPNPIIKEPESEKTQRLRACLEKARLASTLHGSMGNMRNRAENLAAKKAYEKAVADFEKLINNYYEEHVSREDSSDTQSDFKSEDILETRKALRRSSTFVVEQTSEVQIPISKLKRSETTFSPKTKPFWTTKENKRIGAKSDDSLFKDSLDADDTQRTPHSSPTFHISTQEIVCGSEAHTVLPDKDTYESLLHEGNKRGDHEIASPSRKKGIKGTFEFTDFYSDSSDSAPETVGINDLTYSSSVLAKMLGLDSNDEGKNDKEEKTSNDKEIGALHLNSLDQDKENNKLFLEPVEGDPCNNTGTVKAPSPTLVGKVPILNSGSDEKDIAKPVAGTACGSAGEVRKNDNPSVPVANIFQQINKEGLGEDEEIEPAYESDFESGSDASPQPGRSVQAVCSDQNIRGKTKIAGDADEDVALLCFRSSYKETVNSDPFSVDAQSTSFFTEKQDKADVSPSLRDVEKLSEQTGIGTKTSTNTNSVQKDDQSVTGVKDTEFSATEGREQTLQDLRLSTISTDDDNKLGHSSKIPTGMREHKKWNIEPLALSSKSPPRPLLKFVPKYEWSSSDDDAVDDLQRDISPSCLLKQRQKEDVDGKLQQLNKYAQRNRKCRSPLRLRTSDKLTTRPSGAIPTLSDLEAMFSVSQVSPTHGLELSPVLQARSPRSSPKDEYNLAVDMSPSQLLQARIIQDNGNFSSPCLTGSGDVCLGEEAEIPNTDHKDRTLEVPSTLSLSPSKVSREDVVRASEKESVEECVSSGSTTSGEYTFPVVGDNFTRVESDSGLQEHKQCIHGDSSPRSYYFHEEDKEDHMLQGKSDEVALFTVEDNEAVKSRESAKEFRMDADEEIDKESAKEPDDEKCVATCDRVKELAVPKVSLQMSAMENLVRQISAAEAPSIKKCSEPLLFVSLNKAQIPVLLQSDNERNPEFELCQTTVLQTSPLPLREECQRVLSSLSNLQLKRAEDLVQTFPTNTDAFYAVPDELTCCNRSVTHTTEIIPSPHVDISHPQANPHNASEKELDAPFPTDADLHITRLNENIDPGVSRTNDLGVLDSRTDSDDEDKWHFIGDINDFYKCSEKHGIAESGSRKLYKVENPNFCGQSTEYANIFQHRSPEEHCISDQQETEWSLEEFIQHGMNKEYTFEPSSIRQGGNVRDHQPTFSPHYYGHQVLNESLHSPLQRQSPYSNTDSTNIFSSRPSPFYQCPSQIQGQQPRHPLPRQPAQQFYGQKSIAQACHCPMANPNVFCSHYQNYWGHGPSLVYGCCPQPHCLHHAVQSHLSSMPNVETYENQEIQRHSKASQTDRQEHSDSNSSTERATKSTGTYNDIDKSQDTIIAGYLEPLLSKVTTLCEALEEIKNSTGSCSDKNTVVYNKLERFEDRIMTLLANYDRQIELSRVNTEAKLDEIAKRIDPTRSERLAHNVKDTLLTQTADVFKQNLQEVVKVLHTSVRSETEQLHQSLDSSLTSIQEILKRQGKEINEKMSSMEARCSLEANKSQFGSRGMDCETMKMRIVELTSQRDAEKVFHKITRESLRALERDHDRLRQEYIRATYRREKHDGESNRRRIFQILSEAEETHIANDRYTSLLKSENVSPHHSEKLRRSKNSQRGSSNRVCDECRCHGEGLTNHRTADDREVMQLLKRKSNKEEGPVTTEVSTEKIIDKIKKKNPNKDTTTKKKSHIVTATDTSKPIDKPSLPMRQETCLPGKSSSLRFSDERAPEEMYHSEVNEMQRRPEEMSHSLVDKMQIRLTQDVKKTDDSQPSRISGESSKVKAIKSLIENMKNISDSDRDSGLDVKSPNKKTCSQNLSCNKNYMDDSFPPDQQCGQSGSSETLTGASVKGMDECLNSSPKSNNSVAGHDSNISIALTDKSF